MESLCDRSIERGQGGEGKCAGRQETSKGDSGVSKKDEGVEGSSRYRRLADIPFELVGKVASACAGAETLDQVS